MRSIENIEHIKIEWAAQIVFASKKTVSTYSAVISRK